MDERLAAELELAAVPHDELARRLYRLALRREPEPEALARAAARLADGTLSRATFLHELVAGEEFARVRALDDAVAFATWARRANERPRDLRGPAGADERVIEIPWTLARYRGEPRVLDVGYAHAVPPYLAALTAAAPGEVVGVDLAEADVPGVQPVVADVRALPFEDESFDIVFCISTLEHVGADNTLYGAGAGGDEEAPLAVPASGAAGSARGSVWADRSTRGDASTAPMEAALGELLRVLGDGGRLLVTVPCGPEEDFGWYVRLPAEEWRRLFERAGFAIREDEVYARTDEGWRSVADEDAGDGCLCAELVQRGVLASVRRTMRRLSGR